jgi:hypothetical protein
MQHTEDWLKRWEDIIDQVEKEHIPFECIKKVVFRIAGGRQKTINLRKLKDQGFGIDDIQDAVDNFVQANCDNITNMEFVLDIEAVAELLQPETDKLLRGI